MNKDDLAFARSCAKGQKHYQELFFMQSPQEKCRCRRCRQEIALVKSLNDDPNYDLETWVDGDGKWWCQGIDPHDPIQ